MKVFVALLVCSSLATLARASLEPAGYKPPGSYPRLYLPSNRYVPSLSSSLVAPSKNSPVPFSQYLPANRQSSSSSTDDNFGQIFDSSSHYPAPEIQHSFTEAVPVKNYLALSGYPNYNIPENNEPAKYEFEYKVKDNYGNDYGHKESRNGENTQGVYTVLLPDGRRQIVHYEADSHGYRPTITYEQVAGSHSGYNNQGYHY